MPMAAFDSTIIGVSSTELRSFCTAMLTPMLGFLFLYLLGRPLKKIPIIDVDSDYKPPRWVLPAFALGSTFMVSVAFSCSIFLITLKSRPSAEVFLQQYERSFDLTNSKLSQPMSSATLQLEDYVGASTLHFFVNGY